MLARPGKKGRRKTRETAQGAGGKRIGSEGIKKEEGRRGKRYRERTRGNGARETAKRKRKRQRKTLWETRAQAGGEQGAAENGTGAASGEGGEVGDGVRA